MPSTDGMNATDRADLGDRADRADLGDLGLDEGGHLLIDRGLNRLAPGGRLAVTGRHPALAVHLAAWCREHGHRLADPAVTGGTGGPADLTGGDAEPPLVVVKGQHRPATLVGRGAGGIGGGPARRAR